MTTPATTAAPAHASAALAASSPTTAPTLQPMNPRRLPANAVIPCRPSDYVPQSGATYRKVSPKKTELLVLAQAVQNLAQFASYTQVMGNLGASSYCETALAGFAGLPCNPRCARPARRGCVLRGPGRARLGDASSPSWRSATDARGGDERIRRSR